MSYWSADRKMVDIFTALATGRPDRNEHLNEHFYFRFNLAGRLRSISNPVISDFYEISGFWDLKIRDQLNYAIKLGFVKVGIRNLIRLDDQEPLD